MVTGSQEVVKCYFGCSVSWKGRKGSQTSASLLGQFWNLPRQLLGLVQSKGVCNAPNDGYCWVFIVIYYSPSLPVLGPVNAKNCVFFSGSEQVRSKRQNPAVHGDLWSTKSRRSQSRGYHTDQLHQNHCEAGLQDNSHCWQLEGKLASCSHHHWPRHRG